MRRHLVPGLIVPADPTEAVIMIDVRETQRNAIIEEKIVRREMFVTTGYALFLKSGATGWLKLLKKREREDLNGVERKGNDCEETRKKEHI